MSKPVEHSQNLPPRKKNIFEKPSKKQLLIQVSNMGQSVYPPVKPFFLAPTHP